MSRKERLSRLPRKIHWEKIPHVDFDVPDEKSIVLKLNPTSTPFPRVTIITLITDAKLFPFSYYSWKSMTYPKELLNWVIFDPDKTLENVLNVADDSRIRIVNDLKGEKFGDTIKRALNYVWLGETHLDRPNVYMTMDCGDVMFPDTLVIKHRALEQYKKSCVVPDTLAYYNLENRKSFIYKFFIKLPRSGLYFKKQWWTVQSHLDMVGLPYIGNCITIGVPAIEALPQPSSIRFFDNFPPEVKELIRFFNGVMTFAKQVTSLNSSVIENTQGTNESVPQSKESVPQSKESVPQSKESEKEKKEN